MKMLRLALLAAVVACSVPLAGCSTQRQTTSRTYSAQSDGTVSAGVRSASDGVPGVTGPQELFGIYIPAGPFAVKGAILWDGTTFNPLPPPVAPTYAPAAQGACMTQTTVMEPETYYVTETRQVPRTRMVPRTVNVPSVTIPIPQAVDPCAPAPQAGPACGPRG